MKRRILRLLVLFFGLLFTINSAEKVFADGTAPPTGYPLGVSTKTNLTAGGTIYFNTDQLQEKQMVGQFLAKNITSNGSSGLSKGGFQNYQNTLPSWGEIKLIQLLFLTQLRAVILSVGTLMTQVLNM